MKKYNKKPKLFGRIRFGHLGKFLRVDLQKDGFFSKLEESVAFEILKTTKDYIIFKIWHMIYYPDGRGVPQEDSQETYKLWVNKHYTDESRIEYLGDNYNEH